MSNCSRRADPGPQQPLGSSPVGADFDRIAWEYDSHRLAPWYRAQGRLVLEEIGDFQGLVVDVGCGTAWFLRHLLDRNPEASGIGVDVSREMIEVAREKTARLSDRLMFVHGDWEAPETRRRVDGAAAGRSVALVTCISAFHYMQDPRGAARAMHDLLAPGGRVLLVDRAMEGSVATWIWDVLHRRVLRDGVRFYRTGELVSCLREAGFGEVGVEERIRRLLWKGKLVTSLGLVSGRRDVA